MNVKLSEITTQYHTFVDNQVLTKAHLNGFIDYFEDQDRLSRILLHGIGIVCGFGIKFNATDKSVTIGQGVGITTDGDLITLRQEIESSANKSIGFSEIKYTHALRFEDKFAEYPLFYSESIENGQPVLEPFELWELLDGPRENAVETGTIPNIERKAVVLYLESYPKDPHVCTTIDCDNQGVLQVARLRVLLMDENDATLLAKNDPMFSKFNVAHLFSELPHLALRRVILKHDDLTNPGTLKKVYFNAINSNNLKSQLINAINKILTGFGPILKLHANGGLLQIASQLNTLVGFDAQNIPPDIQYRYDFLKDLVDTYNEIKELLLNLSSECLPNLTAFPKHLILGIPEPATPFRAKLRHGFYDTKLQNSGKDNIEHCRTLFFRLAQMVNTFSASHNEIRITPSKGSGRLSQRAIPFYYRVDRTLLKNWDYRKTGMHAEGTNLSYHRGSLPNLPHIQQPLLFNTDQFDFYRIEGLQSNDALNSFNIISELIKEHGLDFNVKNFDIIRDSKELWSLVKNGPSLEHRAGVPMGGTFAILSDKNKIIADFALSYRVQNELDLICCPVIECTYPWISSLKYLNNLVRSQKGTTRDSNIPQNYKLQILEYRINGVSLISGSRTIDISMKQIARRRMHAVIDALNENFPEGLIFDFNESQKRFVITYKAKDNFILRLRDSTLNINSIIYTYSQSGLLKDNKTHRTDAMICRELKQYNNELYKKLHTQFAPYNKDDDYGKFIGKWAEWEKLIDELRILNQPKRIFKTISDMPANIVHLLGNVKNDINHISPRTEIRLDGDWVNGTWVDETMLDISTPTGTDAVSRFIRLRKLLHNKTGVSKLSIYITNKPYGAQYEPIIEKYDKTVDFYFTRPTGPNVKAI